MTMWSGLTNGSAGQQGLRFSSGWQSIEASWKGEGEGAKAQTQRKKKMKEERYRESEAIPSTFSSGVVSVRG